MKWIGQHIYDQISRFRDDVYLEDSDLTCTSGSEGKPLLTLKSTNTTISTSSELKFLKDAANVQDDEMLGEISFFGDNDAGTPESIQYGRIICVTADVTDGEEAGNMLFQVPSYDGVITNGLKLLGDTNADGEVDVTIASGAGSTTTIAGDLTVNGDSLIFESSDDSEPVVQIKNTNSNTSSAELHFVKDKGAAGADGDELGIIKFYGDDAGQNQTNFGHIKGAIATAADGTEGGSIKLAVASHDGEIRNGLQIIDGDAEDEIDVIIGGGTASLTTVAGTLTMGSTATINNSGVVQVAAQTVIDHDQLANFAAGEHFTQANITTVGTIGTGVWNGTAVASAYLDADTAHLTTAQTFTGIKEINSRKYALPSSTVGDYKGGDVYYYGDGSTVKGGVYYINGTNWTLADADAEASTSGLLAVALGTDPDVDGMLLRGFVTLLTEVEGTEAIGSPIYLSATDSGKATITVPGSGDFVRVLGYSLHASDNQVYFNPDNTWVEVA